MKVYLAHNFAARSWLRDVVKPMFEQRGHVITSSWVWDDAHLSSLNAEQSAVRDLADIEDASYLVLFTDQFGERVGKGKWVEMGYALRAGKTIICIGERNSCIFTNLPTIVRVDSIERALTLLPIEE